MSTLSRIRTLLSALQQFFKHFMQFLLFRFAFRIYDIDNDGFISNGELFQVNIISPNKEICVIIVIYSGVEDDGG